MNSFTDWKDLGCPCNITDMESGKENGLSAECSVYFSWSFQSQLGCIAESRGSRFVLDKVVRGLENELHFFWLRADDSRWNDKSKDYSPSHYWSSTSWAERADRRSFQIVVLCRSSLFIKRFAKLTYLMYVTSIFTGRWSSYSIHPFQLLYLRPGFLSVLERKCANVGDILFPLVYGRRFLPDHQWWCIESLAQLPGLLIVIGGSFRGVIRRMQMCKAMWSSSSLLFCMVTEVWW